MNIYKLTSNYMEISLIEFGARIVDWKVHVNGTDRHIVLGYGNISQFTSDPYFLGAIVGPYANRIKKGIINISEEKRIQLKLNERINHLHGGPNAIDSLMWKLVYFDRSTLMLSILLDDGWNGYPGPIELRVTYLLKDYQLTIKIETSSPKLTISGPTSHSYFNLNGVDSKNSGLEQWLQSNANYFQHSDMFGVSINENLSTAESLFDLHEPVSLSDSPAMNTLDHNFIFKDKSQESMLYSYNKDLALKVTSDYPAVQLYTGCNLAHPFSQNAGVCIEPHFGANAPNHIGLRQGVVSPNEVQIKTISYELIRM